jgi:hypothetical protein
MSDKIIYDNMPGHLGNPLWNGVDSDANLILINKALNERIDKLTMALKEIALGEGAFSHDQLTHASNCIENMKDIARKALEYVEAK